MQLAINSTYSQSWLANYNLAEVIVVDRSQSVSQSLIIVMKGKGLVCSL